MRLIKILRFWILMLSFAAAPSIAFSENQDTRDYGSLCYRKLVFISQIIERELARPPDVEVQELFFGLYSYTYETISVRSENRKLVQDRMPIRNCTSEDVKRAVLESTTKPDRFETIMRQLDDPNTDWVVVSFKNNEKRGHFDLRKSERSVFQGGIYSIDPYGLR